MKPATFAACLLPASAALAWMLFAHENPPPAPAPAPMDPEGRVKAARAQHQPALKQRFAQAGLDYPPREIFLRAFKNEAALEVWARGQAERFRKVATFAITASSGQPGPKRREGDRQVPEGFYVVEVFNPQSLFHLSLGLNYPNTADRILGDPQAPGSEIYIHGGAQSVGCLPLGDPAIEELFLMALDARSRGQAEIAVHIFPARMSGPGWEAFLAGPGAGHPELKPFWESLRPAYEEFERRRRVPRVRVTADGAYELAP